MRFRSPKAGQQGLSFIELIVVLVVVSLLGGYAIMKMHSTADNTLWFQANKLARDIRHVQVLSSTYGKSLQMTVSSAGYSVACEASLPCNSTILIDPVTGDSFSTTFQNGVAAGGAASIVFDNQGRPLASLGGALSAATTTITLSASTTSSVVTIAPNTGFVSVTP
jgi:prepilin-type N-terminal cleavage/methylation domain-containing protein